MTGQHLAVARLPTLRRRLPAVLLVAALGVAGGAAALVGPAHRADRPVPLLRAVTPRAAELIAIPGGDVPIGDDDAPPAERPAFRYQAHPLLMDRTPVTVAQFGAFVRDTGYVTDAERFGTGAALDEKQGAWIAVAGADWRRPWGPAAAAAPADHPVTQVSWHDADAFCRAYDTRLPSEFEWERAARLGQTPDGHVFKAGDPLKRGDHFLANVWTGLFPFVDDGADGYRGTSPVGGFGAAPSGLTDMAGNVWEWTASWYVPYAQRDAAPRETAPPSGGERVQRGGSFLCDPGLCQGFRATARGHATPDSSFVHVGFRCVVEPGRETPLAGRIGHAGPSRTLAESK